MKLPKGWEPSPIGDLCDLINGRAFKPTDWSNAGLPIIRIQNLNRQDADYNFCDFEVDDRFLVEPGELLFAWSGTPGTSFGAHVWNGPRAVLNQHIFRVRHDSRVVDRDFFKRAINSTLIELIGKAHGGVGLAHVTKGKFEGTEVPVPPLAEQRRIVAKLDALTARLARARAELDRVPMLAEKLRRTCLDDAFSDEKIATWNSLSLEQVVADGLIGLVRSKAEQGTSGAPYLRMGHYDLDGRFNENDLTAVECSPAELRRFELCPGDVLFNTRNSVELVGKVALWREGHPGWVFNNNILRLRFMSNVLPAFAFRYMMSPRFRTLMAERTSATTSVAAIYQRSLYAAPFPVPSLEDQHEIVSRIDYTFARADRLETEAARARALIDRLESAILTKAFRGELVPQDPNDEPASVLLDRIRAERAAAPKAKRGRRSKAEA